MSSPVTYVCQTFSKEGDVVDVRVWAPEHAGWHGPPRPMDWAAQHYLDQLQRGTRIVCLAIVAGVAFPCWERVATTAPAPGFVG